MRHAAPTDICVVKCTFSGTTGRTATETTSLPRQPLVQMPPRPPDDAWLLRESRRDRDAFAQFYRVHALMIYRYFRARVDRDHDTASELTAETFAEALTSLPRFGGTEPGDGTAWLIGIARNLGRDHHRRRRVRETARRQIGMPLQPYATDANAEADDRLVADDLRPVLEAALAGLPAAQRDAVWMRVVDELGYPEIATRTRRSEQAVRLRVFRALRALRLRLTPAIREEEC